jgi:hypothetical protein
MNGGPERKTVAGIFKSEADAARALEGLIEAHFDAERDVSVIVSRRHEREKVAVRSDLHIERTSAIGAAVGAVLAGVGIALAGLTTGPFTMVAAGPVVAALEGAYAGGATGFAIGALAAFDVLKPEADFAAAHFHDGVVCVGVHAAGARAELARGILGEAGAKHFMERMPELLMA